MDSKKAQEIAKEFFKGYIPVGDMVKVFDAVDACAELCKLLEEEPEPSERVTGYERVDHGEDYFYNGLTGTYTANDVRWGEDNYSYNTANYYANELLAKDCIRADTLMRKLRRFSAEHRDHAIDWETNINKWAISFNVGMKSLQSSPYASRMVAGAVYFDTAKHCADAITEFRDELLWYFTEYRDTAEVFDE